MQWTPHPPLLQAHPLPWPPSRAVRGQLLLKLLKLPPLTLLGWLQHPKLLLTHLLMVL